MFSRLFLFRSSLLLMVVFGPYLASAEASNSSQADKPGWFLADTKKSAGWDFFCEGAGKTEAESKGIARAMCSQKICMLFGVEVTSEIKSTETLSQSDLKNTVIEKCPQVRVTGRVEKKATTDCGEESCTAFIHQFYPIAEYDKEYERLNRPAIVKEFEKTIIIRENDKTFQDPKKCQSGLKEYAAMRGEIANVQKKRIAILGRAAKDCKDIDDRNVTLQTELRSALSRAWISRPATLSRYSSRILMTGGSLEKRVGDLQKLEGEVLEAKGFEDESKKLVKANYDWLFPRESHIEGEGFILLSGKKSSENPMTIESRNCQKHYNVLATWPDQGLNEVLVCVPQVIGGETCQTTSRDSLMTSYSVCLCNLGSKSIEGCTRTLLQFVSDHCEDRPDRSCIKKLGRYAADFLKLNQVGQ